MQRESHIKLWKKYKFYKKGKKVYKVNSIKYITTRTTDAGEELQSKEINDQHLHLLHIEENTESS